MTLKELLNTLYTEKKIYLTNKHGEYMDDCNGNIFNMENNFQKYENAKVIYCNVYSTSKEIEISINRTRK